MPETYLLCIAGKPEEGLAIVQKLIKNGTYPSPRAITSICRSLTCCGRTDLLKKVLGWIYKNHSWLPNDLPGYKSENFRPIIVVMRSLIETMHYNKGIQNVANNDFENTTQDLVIEAESLLELVPSNLCQKHLLHAVHLLRPFEEGPLLLELLYEKQIKRAELSIFDSTC